MHTSDATLAATLAETAGRLLMALRACPSFEGKALGALGDKVSNTFLMNALAHLRPDDAILSEESADDKTRLGKARVWIIDPLDGTREFGEGRSDWAVHVGLAIEGAAALGAVALPALELILSSGDPHPARPAGAPPRMLVSRTRPAPQAVAVAKTLGAELVPMGSAGAKAMAVVRGEAEIYLHDGGQYEWDNCAPAAVAQAAGLHVSRADGAPLKYNGDNPWLPDLLICRPELAERALAAIAAL